MNRKVDKYIKDSKNWKEEITELRSILLQTGLEETIKWSKPCYTYEEKNIAVMQPFKACLGLMFFKGALLKDTKGLLVDNGPNSQSAMRLEFRSVSETRKSGPAIKRFVKEAIKIEKEGTKVEFKSQPEPIPSELSAAFKKNPKLQNAFQNLTPGRQRGYILHFSSAKQSETRSARIQKCAPKILKGKGLNDR